MTTRRIDRMLARGDRGEACRAFNYRQAGNVAHVPTAMAAAFMAAKGPPDAETPEAATSGAVQDAGGAKLQGDRTTTAGRWKTAHAAAVEGLVALYGEGGAK